MAEVLPVQIRVGLDARRKDDLIRLFCDAFPGIIVPVFGSVERCAQLLERSLADDRVLTAIMDDRLIGFAGLHFSGQEWFDPSLSLLICVARWGFFRIVAVGIALFRRPRPDAMHLDTLAVHPDMRGQGIGTRLIDAVVALANAEGKRFVTLEVEDNNPRAKHLYERIGFVDDKFEKLPWPWRTRFQFSGLYCMSKDLQSSEP